METSSIPDPVQAFTPKMEIAEEFQVLRTARRSLGGEALKPVEIDMDILVDAYPREANFLSSSTVENFSPSRNQLPPRTPTQDSKSLRTPSQYSSRKTPTRRFFKSEHEREYALNLMKELVQIYILQGVHGKEAFRKALNETRRRVHVRRGETAPSPPPVLSPVHASPYPKISPPKQVETPYSNRKNPEVPAASPDLPSRRLDMAQGSPVDQAQKPFQTTPRTPSRVKSMVAAIQSATPSKKPLPTETPKRTPGSTRVKAVAETLEKSKTTEVEPVVQQAVPEAAEPRSSTRLKKSPVKQDTPSKRKNQELVEKASPSRGRKKEVIVEIEKVVSPPPEERKRVRRAAAVAVVEEETTASVKKAKRKTSEPATVREASLSTRKKGSAKEVSSKGPTKKRKKDADLETIPEDEAVSMPVRPTRKAKTAGKSRDN